ncbi:HNH endonuclease [Qipengyuania sp.]|uniref:HNH endonuclease n=1 Tax=Qipengyuania sp. TaxID=2004515 RepID=UPI0035C85405
MALIAEAPAPCWLCARALGARVQWHHTVPKTKGGRTTVPVHPICHRTIHTNFTNAQLARMAGDRNRLLEHGEIARFVAWIGDKPPDFHAPTRSAGRSR